jgi:ribose 5-phosphate isomerase B
MPIKPMIYLGADHAGFKLKESLKEALTKAKLPVCDLSPRLVKEDDYPLAAKKVTMAILHEEESLGVLVCGTGHGMDIAANRHKGARAIVARSEEDAKLSREHNHANILVLGGWVTKPALAKKIVMKFLKTKPSKTERHVRRVKQLDT